MKTKIITAFTSLIATLGFHQEALAENACIANYSTDEITLRSAHEKKFINGFSGALKDIVEQIIEDDFKRGAWSSPFSQARYDDLIYTVDYIEKAIDAQLATVLRFAIVQQFSGPISRTRALEPLDEIILGSPDLFEELLDRHVRAYKFWSQFSLCDFHSPYHYYSRLHAKIFYNGFSGSSTDALRAYGEVYSKIPVRKLGGERLIIRTSYLPDPLKPKLRFVAPPCNGEDEIRNLHFSYDVNSQSWKYVEPFIEAGGWHAAGFEDPIVESGRRSVSNTLLEYKIVQEGLRQRFERFQAELGLPVEFPRDLNLECKKME